MNKQFGYAYWQKVKKERAKRAMIERIGSWLVFGLILANIIFLAINL